MFIRNTRSWSIFLVICTTFFLKQHAEHLKISYYLIFIQIEGMRPRRANRIIDRTFIWPSCLCHFRRCCYTSVKLFVFPPSWWSFILYDLNLDMPLTELYMGRPLLALYFVVNSNPPKIKWFSSFSAYSPSPICPVCFATVCGQMSKIGKPGIWRTRSIISSILSLLSY